MNQGEKGIERTGQSRDDVDEIVAGWEIQRPDFDARPLAVFSRMLRLQKYIERMRRATFAAHGLETWEFEMLAQLRRASDHQLKAGQLMQETLVSSGTITNRLDRMQEHGFVTRQMDPKDKRVVLVQATPKGISAVDDAMAALLRVQRVLLEPFDDAQTAQIVDFLRVMLSEFNDSAA